MRNDKGFTLTELVVVMAIFIVFLVMMSSTFENVIRRSSQQGKSAFTQIEGVVGLEMLRTDVSHAGYALPWSFAVTPGTFQEVTTNPQPVPGITASSFNDSTPWAVRGGVTSDGSHYLVLKSGMLALNTTSVGRYAFVDYSSGSNSYISPINDANSDVRANRDRVITLLSAFSNSGTQTKQLLMKDAAHFSYTVPAGLKPSDPAYMPSDASQSVYVYALNDDTSLGELKMPYNRADYFIYRTASNDASFPMPSSCAPGTGILFKAVAGQKGTYVGANGEKLVYPLLNCVGDMQVLLGLDPAGDGNMSYIPPDSINLTFTGPTAPDDFRSQLKEVRVYLLAHEGKMDPNFTYPSSSIAVGDLGGGRTWTPGALAGAFGANWMHYRWKVYSVVVQLKNLQ